MCATQCYVHHAGMEQPAVSTGLHAAERSSSKEAGSNAENPVLSAAGHRHHDLTQGDMHIIPGSQDSQSDHGMAQKIQEADNTLTQECRAPAHEELTAAPLEQQEHADSLLSDVDATEESALHPPVPEEDSAAALEDGGSVGYDSILQPPHAEDSGGHSLGKQSRRSDDYHSAEPVISSGNDSGVASQPYPMQTSEHEAAAASEIDHPPVRHSGEAAHAAATIEPSAGQDILDTDGDTSFSKTAADSQSAPAEAEPADISEDRGESLQDAAISVEVVDTSAQSSSTPRAGPPDPPYPKGARQQSYD